MAYKFVAILAFASLASCGAIPVHEIYHHAPLTASVVDAGVRYAAAPASAYAHFSHTPTAVAHAAPVAVRAHAQPVLAKHDDEYDPHPQYKYSYDVQDALSGDSKSQNEERDGDVVHGEYSLIDADGFKRVVQYNADPVNGFNAVVNRIPLEHVAKSTPVVYSHPAPAIVKEYAAPIGYHH